MYPQHLENEDINRNQQDYNYNYLTIKNNNPADQMLAERTAKISRNIQHAQWTTCPHCQLYSLTRYTDRDSPNLAPVSPELRFLLIQSGYKDNIALFTHLVEQHPTIVEQIQKQQDTIATYRQKLQTAVHLSQILINAKGDQKVLWQIAQDMKADPKFLLRTVSEEIKQYEKTYPLLLQVRAQYYQEQQEERNKLTKWRKKMGLLI